jgi:6-pyruvoyltetrahydropterin/6-carboxytetrahydropterin synthase
MFTIAKQFYFSASHTLDTLPEDHPCSQLHGHNYIVELVLQSDTLDEHGFVVDYLALKPFKDYIDREFDHHHLNDVLPFSTSGEYIAQHLYHWAKQRWKQVLAVRVSETPKTWAEYQEL